MGLNKTVGLSRLLKMSKQSLQEFHTGLCLTYGLSWEMIFVAGVILLLKGSIVADKVVLWGRDVYHVESIRSYRYHKTDTGTISKWQINYTFNDTFMMIIIRIELI